jgi:Tfp pilus assembly protein PilX
MAIIEMSDIDQKPKFGEMNKQGGIALVMSLIFLLVSTLLALSTLSGNVSEEKMTRNNLQSKRAFEAAEIALLEAEAFVEDDLNDADKWVFYSSSGISDNDVTVNNIGDSCTDGYCTPVRKSLDFDADDPDEDRWTDSNLNVWETNSRHKKVSSTVTADLDLPQQPKYIIEFMRYVPAYDTSVNKLGYSACDTDSSGDSSNASGYPTEDTGWDINWPYCTSDMKEYRITAIGYAGNSSEARVMLQSIYIAD